MMEQEYRREMDQIALSPQAMERIVDAMAGESQKSRRRFPVGRLLAVAAACVVLTSSVLAASPTLRERLEQLLGGFAAYSQSFEDDMSVTDQGVTMRLVSAMADQGTVRLFLEFSGDMGGLMTVGEKGPIGGYLDWENEVPWSLFSIQCIDRDEANQTSLVEFRRWDQGVHEDGTMTLKVWEIYPETRELESEVFWIDFSDVREVESETLDSGEVVLKPGQDSRPLPEMKGAEISSVGFAGDGMLHVLYRLPEEAVLEESSVLGQLRNDGNKPGYVVYGSREGQEFFQDVRFERDGQGYIDVKYCIAQEEIQGWGLEWVHMSYATVPHIEGEWQLTFEVEQLPVRQLQLTGETDWDAEWKVQSLMLTPWSIRLMGTAPYYSSYPCYVTLEDGTVLEPEPSSSSITGPEETYCIGCWEFDQPVEIEKVIALQIGAWEIRLDGTLGIVEKRA